MNGFFLRYYGEREERAAWTARGWGIGYTETMWEPCAAARAEETMREIAEMIGNRSGELHGFTLFFHEGKGWQMSVRRKGETGWDVKIIPGEKAQAILSMLRASGHPDGPITVDPEVRALANSLAQPYERVAGDFAKEMGGNSTLLEALARAAEGRDANTAARGGR